MFNIMIGLYVITGWAGAFKVYKIVKKEREEEIERREKEQQEERFMFFCNDILNYAKCHPQGFAIWQYTPKTFFYNDQNTIYAAYRFLVEHNILYHDFESGLIIIRPPLP